MVILTELSKEEKNTKNLMYAIKLSKKRETKIGQ
jgi:hypothetical protein